MSQVIQLAPADVSIAEVDNSNCQYWPFRVDGPFPEAIFSTDHIDHIVSNIWPLMFQCSATSIRGGLRSHLKKYSPSSLKKNESPQQVNNYLANQFVHIPDSRLKARELTFLVEQRTIAYGRRSTKSKTIEPKKSIGELLGQSYCRDPELTTLFDWFLNIAQPKKTNGEERYLTAALLADGYIESECPKKITSLEFARMILIYASLLDDLEDKVNLVNVAIELGCLPLQSLLSCNLKNETPDQCQKLEHQSSHEKSELQPPSLIIVDSPPPKNRNANQSIINSTNFLREAQAKLEVALDSAKNFYGESAESLIYLTEEKWALANTAIQVARSAHKEFLKCRTIVCQQEDDVWKEISERLDIDLPPRRPEQVNDSQLIDYVLDISKIISSLRELGPSHYQLSSWREHLKGDVSIHALHELITACEVEVINNLSRQEYRSAFESYAIAVGTAAVSQILTTLSPEQLSALITQPCKGSQSIGDAIIFKAAVDKTTPPPESVLQPVVNADQKGRRMLLSFVHTDHPSVKSSLVFSRIMAVERFRSVMLFEPLAQILDVTSTIMSTDIVGRTVNDIADLICTNATILGSPQDISRLIRKASTNTVAYDALLGFSKTPATMQGNFRRLKEKAREALESQALYTAKLNIKNISDFLLTIESGELTNWVISEFYAERSDTKIETRHKEQLSRYIGQMESLIRDCLSEAKHRPDARQKSLAVKLQRLHSQLRASNEVGSLEWLEAQIADILSSPKREESYQYLKSTEDYNLDSTWTGIETEFASHHAELPEFYYTNPLLFKDIASSCIYWRAQNRQPTALEIAETLIKSNQIKAAVYFSRERNDQAVLDLIENITLPIRTELSNRADSIKEKYGDTLIERLEEHSLFIKALAEFEIDAAAEALDMLELIALEASSVPENSYINDRRMFLQKAISKLGAIHKGTDICELESQWKNILDSNSAKRLHLTTVEKVFEEVEFLPPYLENLLATFKEENEDPERWLEPVISLEISEYGKEAADRLAYWARSAHIFLAHEKRATFIICEWFIGFIVERALSMHQLVEPEDLASATDRIFDVSATIINSNSPAECAILLKDTGELPEGFAQAIESDSSHQIQNRNTAKVVDHTSSFDERQMGLRLIELVKAENWSEALSVNTAPIGKADELNLNNIFLALADKSPRPHGAAVDNLQLAASWISGSHELAMQLSESQRLSLAYQILSGTVAAESNEDMPRVSNSNGGWSEILGKSSAFRKMLVTSIPYRVEKVLEVLLSGSLSLAVAEKLWDAATNINDPHLYRTPILSFMYEHSASEAVCRLANRHDPVISARLSQLFELRNVASARPDLIPVAQSVADQIVSSARSVPFRNFVKELPTATHAVKPCLIVDYEGDLSLHDSKRNAVFDIPIIVTPNGLVPTKLEANLFDGDDVYFEDNSLRYELSSRPTYFASDFNLRVKFGPSWYGKAKAKDGVRVRIRAKTLTDELFAEDIVFRAHSIDPKSYNGTMLSTDTLLDLYPGVSNTPAIEDTFIGRHDELELLNQVLVSARRPSPVLLTGMRRIGKTSLLFAFHKRLKQPGSTAITFYLSLAERRVEFVAHQRPVSATLFRAISHGLVRPNLSVTDQNYALCSRIRQRFEGDWKLARNAIQECYDEESLSDSLIALSGKLIEWVGAPLERLVLLIDEAEALVAPYQAGGDKRLELEQLLQSLREVSQSTGSIGILLSGSNHINVFAREYKNAFFGSSQAIELTGLKNAQEAADLVAPKRVSAFIQFDPAAIEYAFALCAGMPQFLWQVGATVAHMVRVGTASKRDVRLAISALIGDNKHDLPFKAYEILEPIDSILSLENPRERDLLWMLLYRIAGASSLVAEDATIPFVIDHALASLDERPSWNRRLRSLVDLKIVRMESVSTVRFHVPLFAEGFRAKKHWQEYNARLQGVSQ